MDMFLFDQLTIWELLLISEVLIFGVSTKRIDQKNKYIERLNRIGIWVPYLYEE